MSIDSVVAVVGIVMFLAYVALAVWLGADTRDGADGASALGRRQHRPAGW